MPHTQTPSAPAANGWDLLTADQVVDRLLKFPKLRPLSATCVLPAVRVDNEWRFRRDDLERWIDRWTAQTRM